MTDALTKRVLLPFILLVSAFLVYLRNGTAGGLPLDNALYVYWGQQLLNGTLPYVSVFDIKGPLSGFFTAFCIFIGRLFHSNDDVRSSLIGFMFNNALAGALIFTTVRKLTRNLTCAFWAFGQFLICYPLAVKLSTAPEPKLLIMTLELLLLASAAQGRWLLVGMVGMLCFLIWQPSIVLMVGMFFVLLFNRRPLRDYVWFALGCALPLMCIIVLYVAAGQLVILWDGLIGFQWMDMEKPIYDPVFYLQRLFGSFFEWFHFGNSWVFLAGWGFILFPRFRVMSPEEKNYTLLLRSTLCLWLICMSFDPGFSWLFVLVPLGAIGSALMLSCLLKLYPKAYGYSSKRGIAYGVLALFLIVSFYTQIPIHQNSRLEAQLTLVNKINVESGNTSKLLTCGALPYRVLLKKRADNPYDVLLRAEGVGHYIERIYSGRKDGMIKNIMEKKPDLVVISETCQFLDEHNTAMWEEWLANNYQKHEIKINDASPYDPLTWCEACWPINDRVLYYIHR